MHCTGARSQGGRSVWIRRGPDCSSSPVGDGADPWGAVAQAVTRALEGNTGQLMRITCSPSERTARKMSPEHLTQAVEAIRVDGYIILEDVISPKHLDAIREKMDEDSQKLITMQKWG